MKRKVGRPPAGVNGMRVRDYPQISFRVPPLVLRLFTARAKQKGLSVGGAILNYMAKEASKYGHATQG